MGEFFAGVESIKNGLCYDKRYSFKKVRFDRPQVVMFSNVLPYFGDLSLDLWAIYSMRRDYTMQSLTPREAIALGQKIKALAQVPLINYLIHFPGQTTRTPRARPFPPDADAVRAARNTQLGIRIN